MEKVKNEEVKKKSTIAIIIGIAVMMVVAIVVVIIMNVNRIEPIGDNYFVSDGTKLVLNASGDMASVNSEDERPVAVHTVYYYGGDKINNVKIFFEYTDEEQAKAASELIGESYKEWAESKKINGKYIVFQLGKSQYDGLTTDAVKQRIDSLESLLDM